MALTTDQALQKGVQAHKSGHLKEARRFYAIVLKTQPHHPDANHNIGAIEVTNGSLEKAAPFLKTALEANPNNIQYWVSYIDTLINLKAYEEAHGLLTLAEEKGASGEIFDQFKFRLAAANGNAGITYLVDRFYANSKSAIVNNTAQGWYYSAYFNSAFMKEKKSKFRAVKTLKKKDETLKEQKLKTDSSLSAQQTIERLNKEKKFVTKFNKLKKLINSNDPNLVRDSFADKPDIQTAQQQTFNPQALNIVIIGAGVTGLFFANAVKHALGENVNLLVLDNRSNLQHTREPYKREWLTHIPSDTVQKYSPDNIKELLECFGTDGLIGLQINMLEAILKLSCKSSGVKFYYSPKIEFADLTHSSIDFFIDATGGRLTNISYPPSKALTKNITLQNLVGNFKYTGIIPQNKSPNAAYNDFRVTLKPSETLHYPYIDDANIHTPMIKITAVPEKLLSAVDDFISPLNSENKFFIWKGALRKDLNEGLIFINLTNKEYDLLKANLSQSMNLSTFLEDHKDVQKSLSEDIISFIKMLIKLDQSNKIKIEQPFSYSPYINLNAELGQFNNKAIYPIGDSYFTGNPKVGNGLWTHLGFINDLVKVITEAHKNSNTA